MKKIRTISIVIMAFVLCSIAAIGYQYLFTVKPEPYTRVPFESKPGEPEPVSDLSKSNVVPDSTPDLNFANPDHLDYGKVLLPDRFPNPNTVALSGNASSPLSPEKIERVVQSKIEKFKKEYNHSGPIVYSLPIETEDSVIVAYGFKILEDGSTDSITKRVEKDAKPEDVEKAYEELNTWVKNSNFSR